MINELEEKIRKLVQCINEEENQIKKMLLESKELNPLLIKYAKIKLGLDK